MARAFLVVLDSVGCGGAPDAAEFGDEGANTLGHIAEACASGRAEDGRSGPLRVPNLDGIGLGRAVALASGLDPPGLDATPGGIWGAATEVGPGKDTQSGHWELAGLPVPWKWRCFPDAVPCFPDELVAEVCRCAETDGILGNCHASGTEIIAEEGANHIRTGRPICYTSADSAFQIAAHEEYFGLDRLQALCKALAPTLHAMKVGRVIARPFAGEPGNFTRTANRHDYAIAPPGPTLCDWIADAGRIAYGVGKIGDIFSMQGISESARGPDDALFEHLCAHASNAVDGSLTFANFVEFDSVYGHRRDISGYARHLEWFDAALPRFLGGLRPGDLAIFTADHGNDPTWTGTDHTRERVPILAFGQQKSREAGQVAFVDVAASVAAHLDIPNRGPGRSFL